MRTYAVDGSKYPSSPRVALIAYSYISWLGAFDSMCQRFTFALGEPYDEPVTVSAEV